MRFGLGMPTFYAISTTCKVLNGGLTPFSNKIFHFLSTRPSATAQEIAQETGVDIKEIFRFVRENRLQLVKTDTGIFCESCGIPISQGKICDKCKRQLSEEIKIDVDKYKKTRKKDSKSQSPDDPKYLKKYRGDETKE